MEQVLVDKGTAAIPARLAVYTETSMDYGIFAAMVLHLPTK
jgi:hypothetical protein